jgi:hypothetical protein
LNRIVFFIGLISFSAFGQVIQTARFEIPVFNNEDEDISVLPWNTDGLLFYRIENQSKKDVLLYTKLDSAFHQQWTGTIDISKSLSLVYSKAHGKRAYFLFKPKAFFGDFQLLAISADTTINVVYTIKNIIPFSPIMFEVGNNTIVIAGYYNYRPVAIHFSLITGQSKLLPGFFNDPGEINQLIINPDETIDVVLNIKNRDQKKSISVMNFSADGNSIKNTIINPQPDKSLIFGRIVRATNDSTVIAGVYGKNSELSRGVFMGIVNTVGEYTIRYYNFADLKNFFKYLRVARQDRIKERIQRKKIKGKKIKFNYRIALHEFIPYESNLLLIGEAFYPVYKSTSSFYPTQSIPVYYRGYFTPISRQRDYTFDGYHYTHAVVLGIKKDGHLLWDNSFEIKDVKSFNLEQYAHAIQGKNLNLVYSFGGKLYSKVIRGTEVIEGKTEDKMKGNFATDKIVKHSTAKDKLEYWYGKFLLSYGVQELRNTETINVPLNRKVFFINKITFRD